MFFYRKGQVWVEPFQNRLLICAIVISKEDYKSSKSFVYVKSSVEQTPLVWSTCWSFFGAAFSYLIDARNHSVDKTTRLRRTSDPSNLWDSATIANVFIRRVFCSGRQLQFTLDGLTHNAFDGGLVAAPSLLFCPVL